MNIDVQHDRILATLQFPAKGESKLSDEIFDKVSRREVMGVSVGFAYERGDAKDTWRGKEIGEWELREISLTPAQANKASLITKIGGVETGLKWVSSCGTPKTPRLPTLSDCGNDSATYAHALSRYEQMRRISRYN